MFDIFFDRAIFKEPDSPAVVHPITLTIPQGQVIMIYAPNDIFRNLFLYSFTNNHSISDQKWDGEPSAIEIGGVNVDEIPLSRTKIIIQI